ncbi:TATA box-binding protein [archaeon]|nr:TATA box-binding protein [archaeon]
MPLENILKQKIEINIENVVATTVLDHSINLKKMNRIFDAKYEPSKFPGVIIKLDHPKCVMLVFKSGSLVCTGTKSEEMAKKAVCKFVSELNGIDATKNARFQSIKIVNMVASCNMNCKIHLEKAARTIPRSLYEPDQFPAIIYRLVHPKVVALIFALGKLVCVGSKSTQEVYDSANTVRMELEQMGLTAYDV